MTSLTKGASPRVPASLPYALGPGSGQHDSLGRPDLRWQHGRGLLSQALFGGFFLLARPLIAMQRRIEEKDRLQRLPDYLLKDIGLDRADLGPLREDLPSQR